jgi:hypothetical protein
MKKRIALLMLGVVFPLAAIAHIGESPKECETRYGKPHRTDKDGTMFFVKNGMQITVKFFESQCDYVLVRPESGSLSDDQINDLLKSNGGEKVWKKTEPADSKKKSTSTWTTVDGKLLASSSSSQITITTAARDARVAKEKKEKEKQSTSGL